MEQFIIQMKKFIIRIPSKQDDKRSIEHWAYSR